ncbi:ATP-binding protein [Pontibacillus marinus]|uniref:histidine kinase n=1 Tax=Pontibacillus marinus BH030004 = DSM 16465 TaxID=1385511 RepID=A0A0A5GF05_9BACI|nr:ATP-binding protein [Pontibacillus marinus]KGX91806.1 sensor histidine kinase [Pontibacillus marinus BH030004 = DSM 16465]
MSSFETYIENSKRNCSELYGLDPEVIPKLKVGLTEEELERKKEIFSSVLGIVKHFMQKLIYYMDGTPTLVIITDHEGSVLDIYGDPSIKEMVDAIDLKVGAQFLEEEVGTNSVSLALRHEEPIALIGNDHYQQALSGVACYSAPFAYFDEGGLAGTVSMMTLIDYASQFHLGLLSSAVDSIERELQLQKQNEQLQLLNQVLINSTPLGIVMTDNYGSVLEYNTAAEEITEIPKEFIYETGIGQIAEIENYINQALMNGEKIENKEITMIMKDGQSKVCHLDVFPLFSEGQIIGAFAQFRDMTQYHELQKQVVESEKLSAIGKLGTGLAHEIRNPLTSIMGLTQLLQENNQQNKYLEIITDELERMASLVNQFVILGKPTDIQRESCDVNRLLSNTVELMKSNTRLQNSTITFQPSQYNLETQIDPSKIKQVLINFIKNALEAMPNGGEVVVDSALLEETEEVHISIQDNGEGMTEEEISQLGKLFFTTKENGIGMGLPICFDIVKAHLGRVEYDSEKGQGTQVNLYLPVS